MPTIASSAPAISVWIPHSRLKKLRPLTTKRRGPAQSGQRGTRDDKQMCRAVDEQEAQVAPAIAERGQLALPSARVVLDWQLSNPQVLLRSPDDHLRRELHPGRTQVQALQDLTAHAAHAAVGVADAGAIEQIQEPCQQRIADIAGAAMASPRLDVVHAVPDHDLGAVLHRRQELRDLLEVVRQVGVEHHDVLAAGRVKAGQIGRAVTAATLLDDGCARPRGDLAAPVARSCCRRRSPPPRCPSWRAPRASA